MLSHIRKYLFITIILAAIIFRGYFFYSSVTHVNISGDESIAALMGMGITQSSSNPVMQAKQHPRGVFGRFPLLFMAQPYLFPVDSYFAAPFIRLLPKTAFGIRFTPLLLGILTVIMSCYILLIGSSPRDEWPGLLLTLLPSGYLLLLQGAYGLPGYPTSMFFSSFCVLGALLGNRTKSIPLAAVFAATTGLAAGIACSGTILVLPMVATVGAMVCLNSNWKKALAATPAFGSAFTLGMLPYYAAKVLYPGAHEAVSQTVPLREAFARLWDPTLTFTLPSTLGIRPAIIPDSVETVSILPSGSGKIFAVIWLAIMLTATLLCAINFIRRTIRDRWPSLTPPDIFVGISWMSLFLFVLTTRWGTNEFRYLMPLAWSFPFIVAAIYHQAQWRSLRVVIGSLAMILAGINVANAIKITDYWSAPGFDGYFTDTKPAVNFMRAHGIKHCYSSYFDAYVIDYTTNEKIISSQPLNERFFGWPLPYKNLVDAATNVAYALGPSRRFMSEHFKADLEYMRIGYQVQRCGRFDVYYNFRQPPLPPQEIIPRSNITFSTEFSPETAANMNDGIRTTRWQSHHAQQKGMHIDIALSKPQPVCGITFYYDYYPYDNARAINIINAAANPPKAITNAVPFDMQPFEFFNHHPVYGSQFQHIRFPSVTTGHLRIEIEKENPGRDWTIGEIRLYRTPVTKDTQP